MKFHMSGINLNKIDFDFHDQLNEIARIVKSDIDQTVRSGKGVTSTGGKAGLKALKPSTVAAKAKSIDSTIRSNASKPLVGTGSMINLEIDKATKANQTAKLHGGRIKPYSAISKAYYSQATAAEVGAYHQETRPWFGISKDVGKRIERYVSLEMDKRLARA
jgi:hypothetical protein